MEVFACTKMSALRIALHCTALSGGFAEEMCVGDLCIFSEIINETLVVGGACDCFGGTHYLFHISCFSSGLEGPTTSSSITPKSIYRA